jgi:hypothetical protein
LLARESMRSDCGMRRSRIGKFLSSAFVSVRLLTILCREVKRYIETV